SAATRPGKPVSTMVLDSSVVHWSGGIAIRATIAPDSAIVPVSVRVTWTSCSAEGEEDTAMAPGSPDGRRCTGTKPVSPKLKTSINFGRVSGQTVLVAWRSGARHRPRTVADGAVANTSARGA